MSDMEMGHSAGQALPKVRQQSGESTEPLLLLLKKSCVLSCVCDVCLRVCTKSLPCLG